MDIDFLILADGAQVQGGKLYTLGGGWSFIQTREFPTTVPMAVAFGILVDWNETNIKHEFILTIRHEDSQREVFKMDGQFEQGRPTGLPAGMQQRTMLAVNFPLQITEAGPYVAKVTAGGRHTKRTVFQVVKAEA